MKLKTVLMLLYILLLASCASNPKSYYKVDEKITLTLDPASNNTDLELSASGSILTLVAPELINLGIKGVKSLIANEQKKYTQSYSKNKYDDHFYKSDSTLKKRESAQLSYSGFTITRTVKKSDKIKDEIASKLRFEFVADTQSGAMMAIKPIYAKVNSTKSKLRANDTNVDLLINIGIKAYWANTKDGIPNFNSKEIASLSFNLNDLELGKEYDHNTEKLKNKKSEWFSAIPVSVIDNEIKDYGKFFLEVKVTESDNIKKRFDKFSKRLDSSEELLKILLKEAFNIEN